MQRGRSNWSNEPFSYVKLCMVVPAIIMVAVPIICLFEGDRWLPTSTVLTVLLVGAVALVAYVFLVKVVWILLPASLRSHIPYDRKDAMEKKVDVRSF